MVTPLLEILSSPLPRGLHTFSTQLHTLGCHSKRVWVRCYPVLRGEGLSPSWKTQFDHSVIPVRMYAE